MRPTSTCPSFCTRYRGQWVTSEAGTPMPVLRRRRAMAEPPLCYAVARARPLCSLAVSSRCSQCQKLEPNGSGTELTQYADEPKPPVTAGHPLRPMQPFPEPTSGSRSPRRSSPTQSPLKSQPGGPETAYSGELPRYAAVGDELRSPAPPISRSSRSWPPDLKPTLRIRSSYPFDLDRPIAIRRPKIEGTGLAWQSF